MKVDKKIKKDFLRNTNLTTKQYYTTLYRFSLKEFTNCNTSCIIKYIQSYSIF